MSSKIKSVKRVGLAVRTILNGTKYFKFNIFMYKVTRLITIFNYVDSVNYYKSKWYNIIRKPDSDRMLSYIFYVTNNN